MTPSRLEVLPAGNVVSSISGAIRYQFKPVGSLVMAVSLPTLLNAQTQTGDDL